MLIGKQSFIEKDLRYVIRSAAPEDAAELSALRLRIDGETENLDRVPGEAHLDPAAFREVIERDSALPTNLFLVAEAETGLLGFARCEGSELQRLAHRVTFGVGVLREAWGYGIGKNLLAESIAWADSNGIHKIALSVLATNEKAIRLYERYGFETEGVLKDNKRLADGDYYDTVMMGRLKK
ncbi:GNAT family N-acetyltransferase [Indiicoccus explosivorum]|uniref:GNAT family N-acetyltransferase n=1 Tax=Indiicoccus explosivorum TaxID=1917864 RepID=UPI0015880275|nr:GNAT family protein [Indiicoccus explosivorum]